MTCNTITGKIKLEHNSRAVVADLSFFMMLSLGKQEHLLTEKNETKPTVMNAFELITLSNGLNLSGLFDTPEDPKKGATRFTSTKPPNEIIASIEEVAKPLGFDVQTRNFKMKMKGDKEGRKGHLSVATQVFEVAPSLFMVELHKANGDTLEYHSFYEDLSKGLKDVVWKSKAGTSLNAIPSKN
jgi:uncharacterized protein Veg